MAEAMVSVGKALFWFYNYFDLGFYFGREVEVYEMFADMFDGLIVANHFFLELNSGGLFNFFY